MAILSVPRGPGGRDRRPAPINGRTAPPVNPGSGLRTDAAVLPTPLGPMRAEATAAGLARLFFASAGDGGAPAGGEGDSPILELLRAQLAEYFAGTRRTFTVPLAPAPTPFQRLAREALLAIPYGETRGYGRQAALMGRPGAARAAGGANRANPVALLVPCHRVIGAGGALAGYAGGVDRKAWLLRHERAAAGR